MRKHEISDLDRLYHIKEAIQFILSETEGITDDDFYRAEVLKRAVVRDLEVIGEASNSISDELKQRYPEVQWRQIIATRHRIIHEYFHVSYVAVWEIIKNDLPILEEQVNKMLSEIS
ncbi:MAG: hypothetical protein JWR72_3043 [Flavisolibacter sp.]|jgi:uncharacterized protein with HEPN domain|nr:hypothetical protein [Flavisolibacter sp.]